MVVVDDETDSDRRDSDENRWRQIRGAAALNTKCSSRKHVVLHVGYGLDEVVFKLKACSRTSRSGE